MMMAERGAITVREAGRRGATQTKRKYGPAFYKSIGKKGGETTKQRHGPQFYEKIGRKGGQTMKKLIEQAKRAAKKGRRSRAESATEGGGGDAEIGGWERGRRSLSQLL